MLKKWFCKNSVIALRKLNELKYTCQNIQNQVSADSYITKALCHAETCSQINFSALLTAWQEINVKMWIHVLQSMFVTIKYDFVKTMKNQQFNWKSMFFSLSFSCKVEFKWELFKSLFNQCFYYQLTHVFYTQSYLMSVYSLSDEWSSQDYNSYWKSKSNQTSQSVSKLTDQSQFSASKQSLMITAEAAAMSEFQSVYSNFRWEVNFCCDQSWYECIIRD